MAYALLASVAQSYILALAPVEKPCKWSRGDAKGCGAEERRGWKRGGGEEVTDGRGEDRRARHPAPRRTCSVRFPRLVQVATYSVEPMVKEDWPAVALTAAAPPEDPWMHPSMAQFAEAMPPA